MRKWISLFFFNLIWWPSIAQLAINEILIKPNSAEPTGWIEIKNSAFDTLNLENFQLLEDGKTNALDLPTIEIVPGGYEVTDITSSGEAFSINYNFQLGSKIYLLNQEAQIIDSIQIPISFKAGESYGRYPENSGRYQFFPPQKVSKGDKNLFSSEWTKIANSTTFSPRDQSENGMIYFNNKFWILAGYGYHIEDNSWYSSSDVWNSGDLVNWNSVNDAPPYHPHSAYVTFKGKMWALDGDCWSSVDGVTWIKEGVNTYPAGRASRVTVLRDTLWFAKATSIGYSVDGVNWSFKTSAAPWGSRDYPGFVAFHDSLWYFGGAKDGGHPGAVCFNDVYVSKYGDDWELVNSNSDWPGRYWFSYTVHKNKIWIFGGFDANNMNNGENGNLNDVWYTENGLVWSKLSIDTWPNRHSQFTINTDSLIYLSSGYGHGGLSRMYNDIWRYSEKKPFYFNFANGATYGDELDQFGNDEQIMVSYHDGQSQNDARFNQAGLVRIYTPGGDKYFTNDTLVNVLKRKLMIRVEDVFMLFGAPVPEIKLNYIGFTGNDSASDIDENPEIIIDADPYSPVGEYGIRLTGGYDKNYELILFDGTLTVEKGASNSPLIFPNPAEDIVYVFPQVCGQLGDPNFQLKVFDFFARNVREYTISCLNNNGISLEGLASGPYFIKMQSGEEVYQFKFYKK